MKKFSKFILKYLGWNTDVNVPDIDKVVICLAPHTSNWDFVIGRLYYSALGLKVAFLIKKEWLRPPLGSWMRSLGAIPVDRSKKNSLTDQLAAHFKESSRMHLAITPEGTRKPNPNWKLGFYYIAKKAGVPILPVALDYKRKEAIVFDLFYPGDDEEKDIAYIKSLYKDVKGKRPENFVL